MVLFYKGFWFVPSRGEVKAEMDKGGNFQHITCFPLTATFLNTRAVLEKIHGFFLLICVHLAMVSHGVYS